jgi:hypothetical protein
MNIFLKGSFAESMKRIFAPQFSGAVEVKGAGTELCCPA